MCMHVLPIGLICLVKRTVSRYFNSRCGSERVLAASQQLQLSSLLLTPETS